MTDRTKLDPASLLTLAQEQAAKLEAIAAEPDWHAFYTEVETKRYGLAEKLEEQAAEIQYWKSRAETAELKVLTFHEEIVTLNREQAAEIERLKGELATVAKECAEIAWDAKTNWDAKAEILKRFGVSE